MWEKKIGRVQFSTTRSKRLTTTAVDCNCYLWSVHSEQSLLLGGAFARVKNKSLKKKKKCQRAARNSGSETHEKKGRPFFLPPHSQSSARRTNSNSSSPDFFPFDSYDGPRPKRNVLRVLSKVWFTTLPTQQHSIVGRNFAFLYSFHITLCSSCAEETRLAKEAGIPVVKTGYWTWWHVAVVTHTFVLLQVFI